VKPSSPTPQCVRVRILRFRRCWTTKEQDWGTCMILCTGGRCNIDHMWPFFVGVLGAVVL